MKILILTGGKGTRLWPISRNSKPKQFQKFLGDSSLFQTTLKRALLIAKEKDIFISTNEFFKKELQSQLPKSFPKENIILEPAFRERVSAFLLFFCYLSQKAMNEPVIVLPSDHIIKEEKAFVDDIKIGVEFLSKHKDFILLFGEKPRSPDTGLGYIKKGKQLKKIGDQSFFKIDFFKEKPDLEKARKYLKSKNFFWNTGIFIFIPRLIENLTKKYVFDNWRVYQILKKNFKKKDFRRILKEKYLEMDLASFDYSILENYSQRAILPVSWQWSDIGSWSALKEYLVGKNGSYIKGNFLGVDSKDVLVYGSTSQLVAGCGIKGLIIVAMDDVIFICHKNRSQDVKKLVQKIEESKKSKFL